MRKTAKMFLSLAFILAVFGVRTLGQGVTTASINGTVTDNGGRPLVSSSIVLVHQPSGTKYGTSSRADGRFNLNGLRTGGPYKMTVSFIGYATQEKEDIYLELGQNLKIDVTLGEKALQLSNVTIVAEKNALISQSRTGATQHVSEMQIQSVPTVSRRFSDFSKLSPLFSGNSLQAAGRNSKFNNIQVDGAQYNDLFGLGSTGTPGGQAGINPLSLDAIQEFQVAVAPYDVRMGGFTGGGINAITRSGTNNFSGSAYFYGRNQNFMGTSPDDKKTKMADFKEYQYGFRLGGPIIQNKLFFFVNAELTKKTSPVVSQALSSGPANATALLDRFKTIAEGYGMNPGSYNDITTEQPSTKIFARLDYNIDDQNKLTLRHNYVDGYNDILNNRGANNTLSFDSWLYRFNTNTNSTVLQLNSTFSNNMSNEFILGYTRIRDNRETPGTKYPEITVNQPGLKITAGTEMYSGANKLDQDVFEFTDNFTYQTGTHTITAGTHNEFYKFSNVFLRGYYGSYTFNNLDDFASGKIASYVRAYSLTGDPMAPAEFKAYQLGFYLQDEWLVQRNFKLTYGIRFDVPSFPDSPARNDSVSSYFPGLSTTTVPSAKLLFSPRVGFNWDIFSDRSVQVRGGAGIFTGKVPYVWISNGYGNTGNLHAELSKGSFTNLAFVSDPNNQPSSDKSNKQAEIDLISKDFKMPQLLRYNIGVDKQLPYDFIGTIEALYSKSINDMAYVKTNLNPQVGTLADGRPLYGGTKSGNNNFYDMLLLQNTSEGYQYNFTAQLQRSVVRGISTNLAYTFGRAYDLNSVTSSQAQSQMRYNPVEGDPNKPKLTTSMYEIRHRIMASLSYTAEFFKDAPTSISLFYNGQSGQPYSFIVYGDINNDGFDSNDLFYVPSKDMHDIKLVRKNSVTGKYDAAPQADYDALNSFIENNDYLKNHRGQMSGRNGAKNPWTNVLDVRISQDFPLSSVAKSLTGHRLQVTLDILNVLNLLNHDWGYNKSVYSTYSVVTAAKSGSSIVYDAQGNPEYTFVKPASNDPYTNDSVSSRWAMQLGVRYSF